VIVIRRGGSLLTALEADCHEPLAHHAADREADR
jgi:hypothetical protein